jgi:hypothetical protein
MVVDLSINEVSDSSGFYGHIAVNFSLNSQRSCACKLFRSTAIMKQFIVLLALCFLLVTVQGRDLQQEVACTWCTTTDKTVAEVLATTPSLSTLSAAVEVSGRGTSNNVKLCV